MDMCQTQKIKYTGRQRHPRGCGAPLTRWYNLAIQQQQTRDCGDRVSAHERGGPRAWVWQHTSACQPCLAAPGGGSCYFRPAWRQATFEVVWEGVLLTASSVRRTFAFATLVIYFCSGGGGGGCSGGGRGRSGNRWSGSLKRKAKGGWGRRWRVEEAAAVVRVEPLHHARSPQRAPAAPLHSPTTQRSEPAPALPRNYSLNQAQEHAGVSAH